MPDIAIVDHVLQRALGATHTCTAKATGTTLILAFSVARYQPPD